MTSPLLLAQSGSMSLEQGFDIIKGLGWLVLAVAVLVVVAFIVRRWLLTDVGRGSSQFTMKQMRDMRDQGVLSEDEFDQAKMSLMARGRSVLHDQQNAQEPEDVDDEDEAKEE